MTIGWVAPSTKTDPSQPDMPALLCNDFELHQVIAYDGKVRMPGMKTDSLARRTVAGSIASVAQLGESGRDVHQAAKDSLHCIDAIRTGLSVARTAREYSNHTGGGRTSTDSGGGEFGGQDG
jgi:hypothetical protein